MPPTDRCLLAAPDSCLRSQGGLSWRAGERESSGLDASSLALPEPPAAAAAAAAAAASAASSASSREAVIYVLLPLGLLHSSQLGQQASAGKTLGQAMDLQHSS